MGPCSGSHGACYWAWSPPDEQSPKERLHAERKERFPVISKWLSPTPSSGGRGSGFDARLPSLPCWNQPPLWEQASCLRGCRKAAGARKPPSRHSGPKPASPSPLSHLDSQPGKPAVADTTAQTGSWTEMLGPKGTRVENRW